MHAIFKGTATETGQQFFTALVQNLTSVLGTRGAWVTEYLHETRRLRALAFWLDGQWIPDYEMDIAGSPCERVNDTAKLVYSPDRILDTTLHREELRAVGAASYMGVPLQDTNGRILGHMAVLDRRPTPVEPRIHAVFYIFAARVAAELWRLRVEAEVRECEEKVSRSLNSALDAIIERDHRFYITYVNPSTEKTVQCRAAVPPAPSSMQWRTPSVSSVEIVHFRQRCRRL